MVNSTNLFYEHDTDHNLLFLSPQVENILGYTVDEAMIQWTDFVSDHPINKEGFQKTIRAIKTGKSQAPYELQLIHKTGKEVWVEVREVPIKENGKVTSIIGSLLDITNKKLFEEYLKESEERTRAIFENSLTGILLAEQDGTILEANPALIKMLASPSSAETKKINLLSFAPLKKLGFSKQFQDAVDKNRITGSEGWYKTKWGKELVINYSFVPITKNKKVYRIIGTVEDVTKLREAEKALLESEEKYRLLIENQTDLIVKLNLNGKFEFVSQSYCQFFNKTLDQIIGKNFSPILDKNNLALFDFILKADYKNNNSASSMEQKVKTENGWRWLLWIVRPLISETGKFESFIGIGRDITERKTAELKLLHERNKATLYLETAGVIMLVLNNKAEVIMVNQKGSEVLGYKKSFIIGKNWFENFIFQEDKSETIKTFKSIFKAKGNIDTRQINRINCRYRKVKTINWHNNLLKDEDGKIAGILSSGEDITEILRMQNELESSHNELKKLTKHLQSVRESERTNLASEGKRRHNK